ncbi:MAG: zinc finger domain-containing protein [Candidatus Thiodiazotropha taylori]|nr:zinc finger domain-containing protein [Candidatus Thiodiazotropha taylori]MCG8075687.1 zinc finger domain-containing protein [Candidatus Thiodiazotropha taylori]MCW4263596.1 zinc finger domain-containing protein [Candidatus Thiodiazotropha endolucinida]MCW4307669.1 zinc finger domain-containing protein [Candidatus Thiodiazotropha endolucinida]
MDEQAQAQAQAQAQIFLNINRELSNVSQTLTTQGISHTVSKFDGNPKHFREWVKSIEKYATLVNLPDDRKKLVAYQSSTGAVSGFIHRYMQANQNQPWAHLKQQLAVRFSDVMDAQMALSLLRNCKQKPGENIHMFAERLLSLAEEAYNNQGGDAVERQLIDIFVDGLTNDQLKLKILRDHPDTLQAAIGVATNEQNLRARVNMSHRTNEPMEVDHSRGQRFRPRNRFNRVNTVNNGSNRSIRCWHCGQEGHVIRDCKVKEQGNRPAMGHGRSRTNEPRRPGLQEN